MCGSMVFIFIQDVCVVVWYLYSYRMYVCGSMIFIFKQDICVWYYDIYIHTGCMCVVV